MFSFHFLIRKIGHILLIILLFLPFLTIEKVSAASTPPILVVVNGDYLTNPFGDYLGEILRAEGLNAFTVQDLSLVTSDVLPNFPLTLLAETTLSPAQATMFTNYVNGGGRLIAMRPDAQIKGLFGLGSKVSTVSDHYVKFINGALWSGETPASGLTSSGLQIHGSADQYNMLSGAVMIAEIYSNRTTGTGYPAVIGSPSGRAVAFTYDLSKNIVYTRQGNPQNANQDIDHDGTIRSIDLFIKSGGGSWVDLDLVPIPQADEQQRIFARLVKQMVSATEPLPQLWYFPLGKKTMMIITADAHGNTTANFQNEIDSLNSHNAKGTFYLSIAGDPSESDVANWRSQGHTFGLHPYAYLDGYYHVRNLTEGYDAWDSWFSIQFPNTPKSNTVRNHMVTWEGWTTAAEIAISHNIHLDTDFYVWGAWLQKPDNSWAHGYTTGSGQSLKFIDSSGTVLNNFQQLTQLVDEQLILGAGDGWEGLDEIGGLAVSKQLIDNSQAGDYAAIMTQFHVDYYTTITGWSESTMAYADSLGIPMWNADKWLNYITARHDAELTQINWNSVSKSLSFNLVASGGSQQNLTLLLPATYKGSQLASVSIDGNPAAISLQTIKGKSEAFINTTAINHSVVATYQGGGSSQADLELVKNPSSLTPFVGGDETFSVTVTNKGPSQATGVMVNDLLANGYQYKGMVFSQGSYNEANGEWNVGTLTVNQSATLQLSGTVKSSGSYDNYAQVTASNETDPDSIPNDDSTTQDDDDTVIGITPIYEANLSLTKAVSTSTPYAGDTVVFTLTLNNAGPSSSNSITVSDILPTSAYTFTEAIPSQGTYSPVTGIWDIGTVSPGVNQTLQLSAIVKTEGNLTNTAEIMTSEAPDPNSTPGNGNQTEDDYASVNLSALPAADLKIVKSGGATAIAGQQVTYSLAVTNLGPSIASNVLVTDTLPVGMSIASVSTTEWSCSNTSQTVSCSKNSVGKGSTPSILVTVNVATGTLGNVVNRSRVSSTTTDVFPVNNTSNITTNVSWTANLALSKTSNTTAIAGEPLTYTLMVTNNGPSNSLGVVVTDTLPTGMTYASNNLGWSCSLRSGNRVRCSGGDLAFGATKSLNMVANINPNVRGQLTNQGIVAGATLDLELGNNSASAQTNIQGRADLALTKNVSKNNPDIYSTVIFTVTVTNDGPSQATGVNVTDVLPSGYSDVVVTPKQGSFANGLWDVGTIELNSSAQLVMTAKVLPSGSYNNTAQVSQAIESDPILGNNSVTLSISPILADLSLTQIVPTTMPGLGSEVVITLKVKNSGPNSASGIQVEDTLPPGLSFISSTTGYDKNTGIWTVGTLQSGQEAVLSINVRVDLVGLIKNIAQVSASDQYDPDSISGNNVSTEDDYASLDIRSNYKVYLPVAARATP
jgi:uncharacterized repeat protein (TIGR01451 family)